MIRAFSRWLKKYFGYLLILGSRVYRRSLSFDTLNVIRSVYYMLYIVSLLTLILNLFYCSII
jgi:hypothetical protein